MLFLERKYILRIMRGVRKRVKKRATPAAPFSLAG
jgi:hypothetical protein